MEPDREGDITVSWVLLESFYMRRISENFEMKIALTLKLMDRILSQGRLNSSENWDDFDFKGSLAHSISLKLYGSIRTKTFLF